MKACYFGNEYTHTYRAATMMTGGTLFGEPSITEALVKLSEGVYDEAILPIENSTEGTVNETLDGVQLNKLYITSELVLPISHCLIGLSGSSKDSIREIFSHPQALSQSRGNARKLNKDMKLIAVAYTSEGINRLQNTSQAVLASSSVLSNRAGLVMLEENMQDEKFNETRFVCVRRQFNREGDKASIMLNIADKPGALSEALNILAREGINLSKIESRPSRVRLGVYNFFIDINVNGFEHLNKLLAVLGEKVEVRLLGLYNKAKRN